MHKTGTTFINAKRIVMVKATTFLLQRCHATCMHVGEATIDKQKVRKTDIMDKNNYAKDHGLIHHFVNAFTT